LRKLFSAQIQAKVARNKRKGSGEAALTGILETANLMSLTIK
jgi:hypothetical protein